MRAVKQPLRILYVNGGTMDMGGISTYMMNYYRHFNKSKIQIDFVVHGHGGVYDEEIISMGGRVFHIPTKKENYLKNQKLLDEIMEKNRYRIIHGHMDGMNGPLLKKAYRHGIPVRISHSHNTRHLTNNLLKTIVHENARKQIPKYATDLWACSRAAGEWLYGAEKPFRIIPNAIDTEKYKFDTEKRKVLREEFGLSDAYVIGHVGRFDYQKNQEYLIRIFSQVSSVNQKAKLVLVGDGDRRAAITSLITENRLQKKVILLGARKDVPDILNMSDLFVMPSRFEGLPIAAIEA